MGCARTNPWSFPSRAFDALRAPREDEDDQRRALGHHRECNHRGHRSIIEEASSRAPDEPAHSVTRVEQTECEVSPALGQHARDHRFQERVLRRKADAPEDQADEDDEKSAEENERREERR